MEYLRKAGTSLTNDRGLSNIGQWHSHHKIQLFVPSVGDENTVWNNMPDLGLERYIVFIANITQKVTINCFLFQIKNGRKLPVMPGKFKLLKGNSPFRLDEKLLQITYEGLETSNDIAVFEEEMKHLRDMPENHNLEIYNKKKTGDYTENRAQQFNASVNRQNYEKNSTQEFETANAKGQNKGKSSVKHVATVFHKPQAGKQKASLVSENNNEHTKSRQNNTAAHHRGSAINKCEYSQDSQNIPQNNIITGRDEDNQKRSKHSGITSAQAQDSREYLRRHETQNNRETSARHSYNHYNSPHTKYEQGQCSHTENARTSPAKGSHPSSNSQLQKQYPADIVSEQTRQTKTEGDQKTTVNYIDTKSSLLTLTKTKVTQPQHNVGSRYSGAYDNVKSNEECQKFTASEKNRDYNASTNEAKDNPGKIEDRSDTPSGTIKDQGRHKTDQQKERDDDCRRKSVFHYLWCCCCTEDKSTKNEEKVNEEKIDEEKQNQGANKVYV